MNSTVQQSILLLLALVVIGAQAAFGEEIPDGEETAFDEAIAVLDEEEGDPEAKAILSVKPADNNETYIDDYALLFEAPPLVFEASPFVLRSLDDIFPNFSEADKTRILSRSGLRHSFERGGSPYLIPSRNSGIEILGGVMEKRPSHIIEALVVIPYRERELDMLDIYNALGRVEHIKNQTIPLRDGSRFNIFMDSTRIEGARNRKAIADPAPSEMLPLSETMYLRFTDMYLGDLYIRGDIDTSLYGLTYSITNFSDIRFSIFRVMKAERVSVVIYLEPVKEGILAYSMSGIYLPGFIANKINLTPNINARITALINWITEGLRQQETLIANRKNDALLGAFR